VKKAKILSCAAILITLGLEAPAFAQDQAPRATDDRAATARPTDPSANPDASFSPGNPSPNDQIGDHPSSGDDKRGYDSDDAH
jgi:hypothetical protein